MPDLTIDGSSAVSRFHLAMSKAFKGECKEVVVTPPEKLRALCRRHVERHISRKALRDHETAEQSDRDLLRSWAAAPEGKADG